MPIDDEWIKKVWPWLGGAAVGALLLESHYDDKRKSRAEREDPDGCRELCKTVSEILDRWEPPGFEYEDEYTEDLFDFLDEELDDDIAVEMRRKTTRGLPDILIADRLVLELKVEPKKTERDRLIGQCCDYSVEWVTWAVVIDMPEEKVDALRDLLDRKSLHYIDVIPFNEMEDEDDEDGEDDDEDDEKKTMRMKTRRTTTMRTTGHEQSDIGMFDILGFGELLDYMTVTSVARQANSFVRHGEGRLARQARGARGSRHSGADNAPTGSWAARHQVAEKRPSGRLASPRPTSDLCGHVDGH